MKKYPSAVTPAHTHARRLRVRVSNPDWRRTRLGRHGVWVPKHLSPPEAIDVVLLHLAAVGVLAMAFEFFVSLVARACGISYVLTDVQPARSSDFTADSVLRDWNLGQAADLLEATSACTLVEAIAIMLADDASCAGPVDAFIGLIRAVAEEARIHFVLDDVRIADSGLAS